MPPLGHYIFIYIILSGNPPSVQRFTEGPYISGAYTTWKVFTEVIGHLRPHFCIQFWISYALLWVSMNSVAHNRFPYRLARCQEVL